MTREGRVDMPRPPPPPRQMPLSAAGGTTLFALLFGAIGSSVGALLTVVLTLVGATIWVVCDPARPERNIAVPFGGAG